MHERRVGERTGCREDQETRKESIQQGKERQGRREVEDIRERVREEDKWGGKMRELAREGDKEQSN